jgi:hydroxymethylpyrimidine pyrophosphatase-like HAD family hydrolase
MKNIRLVATDLDGTFLRNDRTISKRNLDALHQLGDRGILRVAATGRNLRKVRGGYSFRSTLRLYCLFFGGRNIQLAGEASYVSAEYRFGCSNFAFRLFP